MARGEITGKKPAQTGDEAKRQAGPPKKTDPKAIEPIGHSEPDSSISVKVPPIRGPPLAMSIRVFCALHGISEDMFFKMKREGWGPATTKPPSDGGASARPRLWRSATVPAASTAPPRRRPLKGTPRRRTGASAFLDFWSGR